MNRIPRFHACAPVQYCNDAFTGWRIVDSHRKDGRYQGVAIHEGYTDEDTARALAQALNNGEITPEDVANA